MITCTLEARVRCNPGPFYVSVCALLASALTTICPTPTAAQALPVITVNLAARAFDSIPPFDQAFLLSVASVDSVDSLRVQFGPGFTNGDGAQFRGRPQELGTRPLSIVEKKQWVFPVPGLKPNRRYLFQFQAIRNEAGLTPRTIETIPVFVIPQANLLKHFDNDFGVVVSPKPGPSYIGGGSNVHFYLVPINKSAPFGGTSGTFGEEILKRVSVFAGLSFFKLRSKATIENMYDVGNPVWGFGIRPHLRGTQRLDFFRFNVGMMYFTQRDANPLITDKRGKRAPFWSVTGDLDLQSVLGPIVALLGGTKK